MIVELGPTVLEDAEALMKNLREEDAYGIELLGINGLETLRREISRSNCCFTGRVDGEVAVVWGITSATLLSDAGCVWMLTNKKADEVPFIFARRSQLELRKALELIPTLYGVCFAYNKRSLRWLKWLGAEIGNLRYHKGIAQYPFTIRRV